MAAEENRLAHFRQLVESHSPSRNGKLVLREGYSAVAEATGLTYDYIYQVYNAKSGKKGLGPAALKKVSERFANGRPAGWMDLPPESPGSGPLIASESDPTMQDPLQHAWERIADALVSMDQIGRDLAGSVLASLAKNPERPEASLQVFEALVSAHGKGVDAEQQGGRQALPQQNKVGYAGSAQQPRGQGGSYPALADAALAQDGNGSSESDRSASRASGSRDK